MTKIYSFILVGSAALIVSTCSGAKMSSSNKKAGTDPKTVSGEQNPEQGGGVENPENTTEGGTPPSNNNGGGTTPPSNGGGTPSTGLVTCQPNAAFAVLRQCGFPKVAQGLKSGSAVFQLPADATEIALSIYAIEADDYNPTLQIDGKVVAFPFGVESPQKAHRINLAAPVSISQLVKAGSSTFSSTVVDAYGTCVQAAFYISGTYKASSCKSSLEP